MSIDPNSAMGPDGIHPRVLRSCGKTLAHPLGEGSVFNINSRRPYPFFFALRATNNNDSVRFARILNVEQRSASVVSRISSTLATLAPVWWPELVRTKHLGSTCHASQMTAPIMKQNWMSPKGLILVRRPNRT